MLSFHPHQGPQLQSLKPHSIAPQPHLTWTHTMNSGEKIHGVPNFPYILAQHENFIVDLTSMVRNTLDRSSFVVLYLKMHSTTINLMVPSMLCIKLGHKPSQSQLISFPPLLLILCFRIRETRVILRNLWKLEVFYANQV